MEIPMQRENKGPKYLRETLKRRTLMVPGVFNGISALLAERYNFDALYLSGSGVAGVMGLPDLSLTTLSEVVSETARITLVSSLPLIVDVDTGFGEYLNVERTVREIERAGASAVHIEDQIIPKKCGHLDGKRLVSPDEMVQKISSAVKSRKNRDFMIIARTDARAVEGMDGAIERGRLYLKAGADAIFPEALEREDEFKEYYLKVGGILLANMTEYGKSPLLSVNELSEMGYKIVIFPLTAFRGALRAMDEVYSILSRSGTQREILQKIMSRKEFYDLINYSAYEEEDKNIASKSNMLLQ
jgi:methylisocitrate lyase